MRAAVIRHERMVSLGNFEPVLRAHGYEVETVDADLAESSPDDFAAALTAAADAELLIVLGSARSVHEADRHAFIAPEIAVVRERLAAARPTLGVCFGAQLIAASLGEEVRPGATVEIGYREVTPTEAGLHSPVRHVAGVPVAEWHGDTFDLPPGVELLASSSAYENEAFGIGDWMLAVQFHPELTDEMHEEWLVTDAVYVAAAGYDPEALRAERARYGEGMQAASQRMLAEYLERLPAPHPSPGRAK
ncbi:glutamine amidotransferase-related protein [Herbiconiux ginsengi]|uniref:GMP synthase (Glutamine-hydrolysing) n=1 Tax=Herbiconiux ginsengi TaxID=381665 RepID=A0A1H3L6T1_9MICO|nr:gamma-glutamyl-gamma-aminobutyrate hydrolase family protein [Herbiconiux ginsengi]SDY59648.1 GMP synthase (glutamine-hydrolysing) [Herbiconiux ginsengi]